MPTVCSYLCQISKFYSIISKFDSCTISVILLAMLQRQAIENNTWPAIARPR